MKGILIITFTTIFIQNIWACETANPSEYYKNEFEVENQISINPIKDHKHLLYVTSKETCGKQGCEHIIFEKKNKTCFVTLGFLTGHITKIEKSKSTYPNIHFKRNVERFKHTGVMKYKKGQYHE